MAQNINFINKNKNEIEYEVNQSKNKNDMRIIIILWLNCPRKPKMITFVGFYRQINWIWCSFHTCYYHLKSAQVPSSEQRLFFLFLDQVSMIISSAIDCFNHFFFVLPIPAAWNFISLIASLTATNRKHHMEWDSIIGIVIWTMAASFSVANEIWKKETEEEKKTLAAFKRKTAYNIYIRKLTNGNKNK